MLQPKNLATLFHPASGIKYLFHFNGVSVASAILPDFLENSWPASSFRQDVVDGAVVADAAAEIDDLGADVAFDKRFGDRHGAGFQGHSKSNRKMGRQSASPMKPALKGVIK
jgi:hypothetical protein